MCAYRDKHENKKRPQITDEQKIGQARYASEVNACRNERVNTPVFGLHSSMKQKQRLKAVESFTSLTNCVMVSTDIAARGLDISGVDVVVHLQPPRSGELLIHRSGRTARANRRGVAVCLSDPSDAWKWVALLRKIGVSEVDALPPPACVSSVHSQDLTAVRTALSIAHKIEESEHKQISQARRLSWMKRMAEEADLEAPSDVEDGEIGKRGEGDLSDDDVRGRERVKGKKANKGGGRSKGDGGGGDGGGRVMTNAKEIRKQKLRLYQILSGLRWYASTPITSLRLACDEETRLKRVEGEDKLC
eukprot:GHVN01093897.1.p1 GENE.GHVN01093897.1~~GHVN01093897.1.p1  ORF type:complete len:304 (-),score=100.08 GHVN01093897.1:383-1294(-)